MKNFDTTNCKKLISDLNYAKTTCYDLEGNWLNEISDISKKQLKMLLSVCDKKYSLMSLALDLINSNPILLDADAFEIESISHQLKNNCFTGFSDK